MARFNDRVVIVTGGNRGLGAAIARDLAGRGIAVAVLGRDLDGCAAVAAEIGQGAHAFACDMADPAAIDAAAAAVAAHYGRIDALVNNAGVVAPIGMIDAVDPDDWARTIVVNLIGAQRMIHATLPLLRHADPGRIVNVSSGAAHRPLEGWSAYCASKAGLAMVTRSVDLELRAQGILCFGIAPGVVDTGMQQQIRDSGINQVSRLPRESLAPPEEPARAIAWLADQGDAELSGQDLDVREPAFRRRCGLGALT